MSKFEENLQARFVKHSAVAASPALAWLGVYQELKDELLFYPQFSVEWDMYVSLMGIAQSRYVHEVAGF